MTSSEQPKILFIINPNAGKRNTQRLLHQLKPFRSAIQVKQTEYSGHGNQIVKTELNKYDVFVAVGGDGTINEIASALVGTDKKLAVFPSGSGNGFAREMGFRKNIRHLLRSIEKEETVQTDVIQLNDHFCFNMAGVGFDSAVAHHFSNGQNRGFWSYVSSTVQTFFRFQPFEATIKVDEQTIHGRFFMISIANTRQFGSNAFISPQSNPTDGQIELALVSPIPIWQAPNFVIQLFAGTLKPSKYIQFVPCKHEVTLTTSEKRFHLDGEPLKLESPVKIEIDAQKLLVVDMKRGKFSNR